ncbi:hypothetical protein RG963_10220 [Methanosarcina sp. Z-7115]|uniref:Uncharacterized protein n=1 Tax=Methanosarcina baikalica TaxID=3073890 RepID=A0ABU2D2C7_9EURY|nr:hypothetical protein [Methanosarcina sp. Z-7115]MDR7666141.1 hypothetical protein [Methanosarcina sp. Z-7115]
MPGDLIRQNARSEATDGSSYFMRAKQSSRRVLTWLKALLAKDAPGFRSGGQTIIPAMSLRLSIPARKPSP